MRRVKMLVKTIHCNQVAAALRQNTRVVILANKIQMSCKFNREDNVYTSNNSAFELIINF